MQARNDRLTHPIGLTSKSSKLTILLTCPSSARAWATRFSSSSGSPFSRLASSGSRRPTWSVGCKLWPIAFRGWIGSYNRVTSLPAF